MKVVPKKRRVADGEIPTFNHVPRVNPAMVKLAREARGFSQSALARLAGLSKSTVAGIEKGQIDGTPSVDRIADAVDMPRAFFYQTDTIVGEGVSEFFHYGRSSRVLWRP